MFKELIIILLGTAVLFAIIGLIFAIKAWSLWTRTADDLLRAKAFLTKPFLYRNFKIIFIVGAFVALLTFLEFVEFFGYTSVLMQFAQLMRFLALTISMLLLVLLAYYWCKLLSSPK